MGLKVNIFNYYSGYILIVKDLVRIETWLYGGKEYGNR